MSAKVVCRSFADEYAAYPLGGAVLVTTLQTKVASATFVRTDVVSATFVQTSVCMPPGGGTPAPITRLNVERTDALPATFVQSNVMSAI